MTGITVTLAQLSATNDIEANRQAAIQAVAEGAKDTDLVVLPEYAMYLQPKKETPEDNYSETLDGEFVRALRSAATEHGVHVVAGMTETNPDGQPFNTLVHIDCDGELQHVYRKIHLYDAFGYRESDESSAGDTATPTVFAVRGVPVGLATCYDLRFPEAARRLVDAGAELMVLPATWWAGPLKEQHWQVLARARAIENTMYVAVCGQAGAGRVAQSMVVDPMGAVLAGAGERPGAFVRARVERARVAEVREGNPCLANRRFAVVPRD